MNREYPIPAASRRVDEKIRRSHFITTVGPAASVEEARAFIKEVRAEFDTANHNCWAYVVGPPGSTGHAGMSDDGEPHGTAGRPMLTVLLHSGIGDIVAVVTRFWGGVKLGKGGLVRAYSGGVKSALESLPRIDKMPMAELEAVIGYSEVTLFHRMLPEFSAQVVVSDFAVAVSYRLQMPSKHVDTFKVRLADLTNGQAQVTVHRAD
ncbi:MAG: YigZ family protein [Caldilineaceae bacterium SB0670_bin_27]|nr:YigZ family protein [Caldilineaceae bacterium SB0670_bin_27]